MLTIEIIAAIISVVTIYLFGALPFRFAINFTCCLISVFSGAFVFVFTMKNNASWLAAIWFVCFFLSFWTGLTRKNTTQKSN